MATIGVVAGGSGPPRLAAHGGGIGWAGPCPGGRPHLHPLSLLLPAIKLGCSRYHHSEPAGAGIDRNQRRADRLLVECSNQPADVGVVGAEAGLEVIMLCPVGGHVVDRDRGGARGVNHHLEDVQQRQVGPIFCARSGI